MIGMILFRTFTLILGSLLLLAELARWQMGGTAFPRLVDDVAAGAALVALGIAGPAARPALHAAGWAFFAGIMLAALVVNLDAWMTEASKPRAGLYVAALSILALTGAAASLWWARRR